MEHLIQAAEQALQTGNWYAALTLGLTLPDICGKTDRPDMTGQARYALWFDTYVGNEYRRVTPNDSHVFLSGRDCYALRCAYLHEGSGDISQQRARETLDRFQFIAFPPPGIIHCNQVNSKLQLDVRIFCTDILNGVRTWLQTDPVIDPNTVLHIQTDFRRPFSI